jgi:predicted nuclease of predicted toxin-antitoxin system
MRVLLDECVDWRLLRDLDDHDAKTVKQLGWEKVKNGALLQLAANHFDVFLTVDSNLPHQQNAATFDIAIIVLSGRTTRLPDLRELLPALRAALKSARAGDIRVVSWRNRSLTS